MPLNPFPNTFKFNESLLDYLKAMCLILNFIRISKDGVITQVLKYCLDLSTGVWGAEEGSVPVYGCVGC